MVSNRLLHAMLHVRDVNASIAFYQACGMKVLSYAERPSGAATSFVGYGAYRDAEHFALELAAPSPKSKQAQAPVDMGTGFQYTALADLDAEESLAGGGRPAAASEGDGVAVLDPDGYTVTAWQGTGTVVDRFRCLALGVSDLDASRQFYCGALGMEEHDAEGLVGGGACCLVRYRSGGSGGPPVGLALVQRDAGQPVVHGNGFDHLAVSTPDVHAAAAELQSAGADVFLPPTVMFGINISGVRDPDGYSVYLTEEEGFRRR